MQFEQIETLLEKYYEGETSLEEENQLKRFFQETRLLPDSLKPHAAQFQHYTKKQHVQLDKFLSEDWLFEKIELSPQSASTAISPKQGSFFKAYFWQMAASISLLLVAFWAGHSFTQHPDLATTVSRSKPVALQQKGEAVAPEVVTLVPADSSTPTAAAITDEPIATKASSKFRKRPVAQAVATPAFERSPSASDRLQLVKQELEATGLTPQESKKVIKLLIKTMNQDSNVNVRLAACEALYQFKDHQEVRKAFIHALGAQTDPLMQLTLIEIVVKLKEETAVPKLQQLMHQEDLLPIVKYKAQEGLGTLI